MNNIVEAIPLPPVYYHAVETSYWRQGQTDAWIKVNETGAKNYIVENGYKKTPNQPGANSEVDKCLMKIQSEQHVSYAGSLAGHDSGVYVVCGHKVLVTDSPKFIEPKPGAWSTLDELFHGMFVDGKNDQRPYFYGWVKSAMETFAHRHWRASQLLALAGPIGSGKSLLQNLLTKMFGDRNAKPYQFMMKGTEFNSHIFGAEHLMIEDEFESTDIRARRAFAAKIKTMLTNRDQNCHGKNKVALMLAPLWRMTMSLNDEPDKVMVLPPIDSDIRDKIILLKTTCGGLCATRRADEQEKIFWGKLRSELPAFLHHIQEYELPRELVDPRYGVVAYQHPEVAEKLARTCPEYQLLELIDRLIFGGDILLQPGWKGTAVELEARLNKDDDGHSQVRRLLKHPNSCGTYLGRLQEIDQPEIANRFSCQKSNGYTQWTILPPQRTATAPAEVCAPLLASPDSSGPPQWKGPFTTTLASS